MEKEKRKAYSEVVEILKMVDEEKLEKIPFEVVELIKNNTDPTYKPQISTEEPLENQNLREETYSIIAWIASKYWGENFISDKKQEDGEELQESRIKNQTNIAQEETRVNEIQNVATIENEQHEERVIRNAAVYNDMDLDALGENRLERDMSLPIAIYDLKWHQRIKIRIIEFIKRIFRGSKKNIKEGVQE